MNTQTIYGRVRGLRPEHCQGERYATWQDIAPVLDHLNRTRNQQRMAVRCAVCNGWHLQHGAARQDQEAAS